MTYLSAIDKKIHYKIVHFSTQCPRADINTYIKGSYPDQRLPQHESLYLICRSKSARIEIPTLGPTK